MNRRVALVTGAARGIGEDDNDAIVIDRADFAPETLAAIDHVGEFDLGLVAQRAPVVAEAHQRPVDAGRGNLQPVFAGDRVVEVEHGG